MKQGLKTWNGAAAVIMSNSGLLMVEDKETAGWSIPSGGIEAGETPAEACIREVWEETGFQIKIIRPLHIKKMISKNYNVTTSYFFCKITGGQISYHDPDESVDEVAWKTIDELLGLPLDYPEDEELLRSFFDNDSLEA